MMHQDYLLIAKEIEAIKDKENINNTSLIKEENNFEDLCFYVDRIYKYKNRKYYQTHIFFFLVVFVFVGSVECFSYFNSKEIRSQFLSKINQSDIKLELLKQNVNLSNEVLNELVSTVDKSIKNPRFMQTSQDNYSGEPFKVTAQAANLREQPSLNSNIVATIQKDVNLIGIQSSNSWVKTYAPNGKEAWVHESLISKIKS